MPARIAVCRCGAGRPDVGSEVTATVYDTGDDTGDDTTARAWPTWIVAVALLAAGGAWAWPRSAAPTSVKSDAGPEGRAPIAADAASHEDAAPVAGAETARAAPETAPSATPSAAPPRSDAVSTPAPLEDLVAQAIGAVVMIETPTSRGTGFFATADLVVSNEHVVGRETVVTLRLHDGTTRPGRVERTAAEVDLALVRTSPLPPPATPLALGHGEPARVGQEVIAIGSALGLQSTVTRGILSARRQSGAVTLLQTDAAINPGNSGGPLLDRRGAVLGVTTLKAGGRAEGVGFAVAAEHIQALLSGQPPMASTTSGGLAMVPPSPVSPSIVPPRPPATAPPLPATSDSDQRRAETLAAFVREFGNLAHSAAQLDAHWESFVRTCRPQASRDGDRAWFVLSTGTVAYASSDGNCPYWLSDLQANSRTFVGVVRNVEDTARRQGLLPGDLRTLRRRYRLDWTGFDR